MKSDKERIKELEGKIYEMESTHGTDTHRYANMDHPRFKGKPGNPYIPLDTNGNLRKGYVG
tara:strand:- start:69210 stop:69392 length:183 start_codon:yes stop_codon:yes gene_type:complete